MKTEAVHWPDTDNIDLVITPETPTEAAMLALLHNRKPEWNENANELIFRSQKPRR